MSNDFCFIILTYRDNFTHEIFGWEHSSAIVIQSARSNPTSSIERVSYVIHTIYNKCDNDIILGFSNDHTAGDECRTCDNDNIFKMLIDNAA